MKKNKKIISIIIALMIILVILIFAVILKLKNNNNNNSTNNQTEEVKKLQSLKSEPIKEIYQDYLLYEDGKYKEIKGLKTIEQINNKEYYNYGNVPFITNNKYIKDMDLSGNTMLFLDSSGKTYKTDSLIEIYDIVKEENSTYGLKITAVSSDGYGTLYLDDKGKLYAVGSNRYGQFGRSEKKFEKLVCLSDVCPELKDKHIVKIQMSDMAAILDSEGNIYTSGKNTYGQLGNGSKNDTYRWNYLNLLPNDLTGKVVTDFKCSDSGLIILDNEGKVYTCGSVEITGLNQEDKVIPTCISNKEGLPIYQKYIIDIGIENKDVAVLDIDGKVYIWGENNGGNLIQNYSDSGQGETLKEKRVVDIEQGNGVTFAITSEGEIFEWGINGIIKNSPKYMIARSLTNYPGSELKKKKAKKIVIDGSNALITDEDGKVYYYESCEPKNLSNLKLNYKGEKVYKLTNLYNIDTNNKLIVENKEINKEEKIKQCYRLKQYLKNGWLLNENGNVYVLDLETYKKEDLTSNIKEITESLLITQENEIYIPVQKEGNILIERIDKTYYNNEKIEYISGNFIITENQNVYQVYKNKKQELKVKKIFETDKKIKKFQPGKYSDSQNNALALLDDGTIHIMNLNMKSPIQINDSRKIIDLYSNGNNLIIKFEDDTYFAEYLANYIKLPEG